MVCWETPVITSVRGGLLLLQAGREDEAIMCQRGARPRHVIIRQLLGERRGWAQTGHFCAGMKFPIRRQQPAQGTTGAPALFGAGATGGQGFPKLRPRLETLPKQIKWQSPPRNNMGHPAKLSVHPSAPPLPTTQQQTAPLHWKNTPQDTKTSKFLLFPFPSALWAQLRTWTHLGDLDRFWCPHFCPPPAKPNEPAHGKAKLRPVCLTKGNPY